jgi:hypothetical protein
MEQEHVGQVKVYLVPAQKSNGLLKGCGCILLCMVVFGILVVVGVLDWIGPLTNR